jgi:hypothetical protein
MITDPYDPCATSENFDVDGWIAEFDTDVLLTPGMRDARVELVRHDPALFAYYYLRHHITDPDTGEVTFADCHLEWLRLLRQWSAGRLFKQREWRHSFSAPRSSGKSSWWFTIAPIWAGACGHVTFVAAFADSGTQSEMHLQTFRTEAQHNVNLRRDFPTLCTPIRKPTGKTVADNEGMFHSQCGFVFCARGIDTATLGMKVSNRRPDLIICHELGTPMLHNGEWIPVEQHPSYRGPRESPGVQVQLWGLPHAETVTPEHRYWTKHTTGTSDEQAHPGWCEAASLTTHHYIGAPIDQTVEPAPPIQALRGHPVQNPQTGHVSGSTYRMEDWRPECFDDPEFWWMVGLWWGDGCLLRDYSTPDRRDSALRFAMANRYPELKERLAAVALKYGRTVTVIPPGSKTKPSPAAMEHHQFGWSDVARWLRTWYHGKSIKVPPTWVERLPHHLQGALIEGYADADGMRDGISTRITSVNLAGLQCVARMLARLGHAATIRKGPGPQHRFNRPERGQTAQTARQRYDIRWNLKPAWRRNQPTHIADGCLWRKIRSIEPVESAVFAPITTGDRTYLTGFGLSHNCDDVEKGEANYGDVTLAKRLVTLQDDIFPLNESAAVVIVGTVTRPGSIIHQLVKVAKDKVDLDDKDTEWIRDQRIRHHHYEPLIRGIGGVERSVWPAKWSVEYLQSIRHTRSYQKNYANDPRAYDGLLWRDSDISYFEDGTDVWPTRWFLWVDPPTTERKTSDFAGVAVLGYVPVHEDNPESRVVVYSAEEFNLTGKRLGEQIQRVIQGFHSDTDEEAELVAVEANQGGDLWLQVFEELPCRVQTYTVRDKKSVRFGKALEFYQQGRVRHIGELSRVEERMLQYPNVAHDDIIDAVAGGVTRLLGPRPRGGRSRTQYPR